jgi:O-antigen ligase
MKHFLIVAPRWLLLALLVYAPWAYGCVHHIPIEILNWAMLTLLGLWLAGCGSRRLWPLVPVTVRATSAVLLLQGWWMNINAQYYYDRVKHLFVPIECLWSFAPGVLDRVNSTPTLIRITGLLGIVCFASDLAQRAEWRRRIAWTIGLSGALLILLGLAQRILGAPGIFWIPGPSADTFFATYYYHGNAGAFINLVLPVIAGFALASIETREGTAQRAIWIPALLVAIAGALAAASKAGIVITLILFIVLLMRRAEIVAAIWRGLGTPLVRVFALIVFTAAVAALGWFGWDRMTQRWAQEAWVSDSFQLRLLAYSACWSMRVDSGWWGFGPGNFMITFPHYTNSLGNKIEGIWRYAHEDYLQAVIEWGWIGATVLGVLFFGGIGNGLRHYWRRGPQLSRFDQMFLFGTLLALIGVALHAMVDFPLQIPSLQLYAAVYLGIAWGSGTWKRKKANDATAEP